MRRPKWLTLVGLAVLLPTAYFGYYAAWGALFIYWGVTSTMSGQVFLLEPIGKAENPILFWIISTIWLGFGALYILADIYPEMLV